MLALIDEQISSLPHRHLVLSAENLKKDFNCVNPGAYDLQEVLQREDPEKIVASTIPFGARDRVFDLLVHPPVGTVQISQVGSMLHNDL